MEPGQANKPVPEGHNLRLEKLPRRAGERRSHANSPLEKVWRRINNPSYSRFTADCHDRELNLCVNGGLDGLPRDIRALRATVPEMMSGDRQRQAGERYGFVQSVKSPVRENAVNAMVTPLRISDATLQYHSLNAENGKDSET